MGLYSKIPYVLQTTLSTGNQVIKCLSLGMNDTSKVNVRPTPRHRVVSHCLFGISSLKVDSMLRSHSSLSAPSSGPSPGPEKVHQKSVPPWGLLNITPIGYLRPGSHFCHGNSSRSPESHARVRCSLFIKLIFNNSV